MKKNTTFCMLLGLIFLLPLAGLTQRAEWVNQVLIGNGGRFEATPPFADYVTMQSY